MSSAGRCAQTQWHELERATRCLCHHNVSRQLKLDGCFARFLFGILIKKSSVGR